MGYTVRILHRLGGVTVGVAPADAKGITGTARAGGPNRGADRVLKDLQLHRKGSFVADHGIVECHGPHISDHVSRRAEPGCFYFTSISITLNSDAFGFITLMSNTRVAGVSNGGDLPLLKT